LFATPSVQLYIIIGSRHQFAFGNWKGYREHDGFFGSFGYFGG